MITFAHVRCRTKQTREATMTTLFIDPRQLPLIELQTIIDIDADGIIDDVELLGSNFQTTFYRVLQPFGYKDPVRVPVLRVRRPLLSYEPNRLNSLLIRAKARLQSVGGLMLVH
jgi:hypothetical protein